MQWRLLFEVICVQKPFEYDNDILEAKEMIKLLYISSSKVSTVYVVIFE